MTNPKWLAVAARRSEEHAWSLGYVFAQYQQLEGQTREQLAQALGCSLSVLDWLSVCRRPDEERFAEQLALLEKRFEVEARRLAVVLRRVKLLGALAKSRSGSVAGEGPFLVAARDHTDDDDAAAADDEEDEKNV